MCGQTDSEFATAHIACPPNTVIVQIPFAAYGLPGGLCPHYFSSSTCDAKTALSVVAGQCLGRNNCSVQQNGLGQMGDPCYGIQKRLRVVVQCAPEPKAPLPSLAPSQGSYVCGSSDREYARATIDCPPGSVVAAIPFASYGLPTGSSCPDFAVNARCHSNSTMSVVAGRCLGRGRCSIQQDGFNGPMGDPCFGVSKRLRIIAQCAPAPSATPSVSSLPSLAPSSHYVCGATDSERTWTHISCPAGSTIVGVPFAAYGTPTGSCPNFAVDPGCDARGTRDLVASLCVGRSSCSVQQDDSGVLGDPCIGVHKLMRIVVQCAPSRPLASPSPSALLSPTAASPSPVALPSASPQPAAGSFVCGASDVEHQFAQVNCPANWVVGAISFASYGLPTGVCPCYKAETWCDARETVAYATSLCLGRNNCSIQQNGWGPLGDPCPNIFKRLRVVARCIPPAQQDQEDVPALNEGGAGSTEAAPSPSPPPALVESLKWLPRSMLEALLWLA